ncbi:MAG TPA: HAMP domain-containing sensor histidine kinase [Candidatus Limnocylindrales bacterium]|nr:HAMP domain-containing sensor histidine kinase [Candidatus Limnocylindrales bacterium]
MRRLIPRFATGLRARLVLAFLAVVAIALALVFATLPRLLDGYFAQQSQTDLDRRAGVAKLELAREITRYQATGGDAPRPILVPTEPLSASDGLRALLGTDSRFASDLAQIVQADVTITIAPDPEHTSEVAYQSQQQLPDSFGEVGQQRESISSDPGAGQIEIADLFWTQSGAAPQRVVVVTLSNPFTFRAQTLQQIIEVMTVAAALAMLAAVFASVLIADRLSEPVRRLKSAATQLADGRLETRVMPRSASPEMQELAEAFNTMAERLQHSIEFIRSDRDRSRDFLADVSHELRTPIAALRTFNELFSDEPGMDEVTRKEFVEQSRRQIERLDWLATNLLELSKLESGLVLLDLRPDDLRAAVENAVAQQLPNAERKNISLRMELPDEPVRQRHDPQRVGQVLTNLIGNAIKFTPIDGRVDVDLEQTKDGAELRVSDSGVGIDPRELPMVFDRFYRGANSHESRASGSGLGLSIVRQIVEMHNGRVAITSTPGKGTQVSVALPNDVAISSQATVRA